VNISFRIVAPLLVAMLLLGGNSWAEEDNQPSLAANDEYEMDSWTSAKEINTIEAYEAYLAEHPNGRHAKFAQAAMNKIKKAENPKGGEESPPSSKTKDVGESASKQPAIATPPAQPVPTEAPAANGAEPKAAPSVAAPASSAAAPSAGEPPQKQ
jgi:hypothetical protein